MTSRLRFSSWMVWKLGLAVGLLSLSGCTIELQHALAEDDANEIYVLLSQYNIDAKKLKEEGGNEPTYLIEVPKHDVAKAMALLKEYSLPRPKSDGLGVFKKMKGMIPTQTEERAMFIEAIQGEVANALNQITGVLDSRVVVNLPENNDLTQPEKKPLPSASVLIKFKPDKEGRFPLSEAQIKDFVASAVPELRKESVVVLLNPSHLPEGDGADDKRLYKYLGMEMTQSSIRRFQTMGVVAGLVLFAALMLVVWVAVRKPKGNGRARTRTQNGGVNSDE